MSDDDCDGVGDGCNGRQGQPSGEPLEANEGVTTLEVIFESLTSPRRRFVLYYLRDHEIATVEELARHIVAWEENVHPDEVGSDRRERVETQLLHTHLPKLADATFVEYDPRSRTVRYTEPPALLDTVLELLARLEGESSE